ncbi:hypothetical protein U0070_011950 [Myodes glareolus]|uniref:Uncharacterized protein n=1 Tax=Myodes glareolus TaxID=447135 RepID=A0AAW0I299_MYOGA
MEPLRTVGSIQPLQAQSSQSCRKGPLCRAFSGGLLISHLDTVYVTTWRRMELFHEHKFAGGDSLLPAKSNCCL